MNFRVLVVDDQKDLADSLAAILCANGYAAKAVYSGDDAVKEARQMLPHLLVADVMMPGLNGIETAIRVRQFLHKCKVLLISGHVNSAGMWQSARRRGFQFDMLVKPVEPEAILSKLKAYQ